MEQVQFWISVIATIAFAVTGVLAIAEATIRRSAEIGDHKSLALNARHGTRESGTKLFRM